MGKRDEYATGNSIVMVLLASEPSVVRRRCACTINNLLFKQTGRVLFTSYASGAYAF